MLRERVNPVCDPDESDLQEFEQPLNGEQVRGSAREAREVLDDNDVDLARLVRHEAHHPLVTWAIGAGAARRAVGEREVFTYDAPVGQHELVAAAELIFDARFALTFWLRRWP